MTYFETPNDKAAYVAGMTTDAYEALIDAENFDAEALFIDGEPHLDHEDRVQIPEDLVMTVTDDDRRDLQIVLDWEAFGGFHNP